MKKTILILIFIFVIFAMAFLYYAQKKAPVSTVVDNRSENGIAQNMRVVEVLPEAEMVEYRDRVTQYGADIADYKSKLSDNIKKLSNKKWLNRSYDDVVGISDADLDILHDNNSIIYNLNSLYLSECLLKVSKLNDKSGARVDLEEFKRILKSNKYVIEGDELIKTVDVFIKKWSL